MEVSQDEAPTGGAEEACETEPASPESETAEVESSEPPLPADVTEAPQHPEHIDLRKVKGNRQVAQGVPPSSPTTRGICSATRSWKKRSSSSATSWVALDLDAEEDPDALIDRIKAVIDRYQKSINLADNTSIGTITKYRIRLGMLYNFLKYLVKNRMDLLWTNWFRRNFGESQLRSAEDYMRIAEVPNSSATRSSARRGLSRSSLTSRMPKGRTPSGTS